MTCKELVEFLNDYLEGQLPDDVKQVFEGHMTDCPCCKHYIETYQDAIRMGKDACRSQEEKPPRMPDDLVAAILLARKTTLDGKPG